MMRRRFFTALGGLVLTLTIVAASHGAALAASALTLTAAQEKGPCGSVEKFNQTKRWEDLPGCAGYHNYDEENRTAMILAKTKRKFESFFTNWIVDSEYGTQHTGVTYEYNEYIKNYVEEGDEERWRTDQQLIAARPAFDEMKRIVEQHLALKEAYPLIKDLASSFGTAKPQIENMAGKSVEEGGRDAEFSTMFVKGLQENLVKVVAAGVPDSIIITSYKGKSLSLGEIRADAARIVSSRETTLGKFKAAEEAKWRPFTSVLKGDRLAHFNRYRDSYEFRGVGGRLLRTPADFQRTPIMAALSVDDNGVPIRWELTIWRFQGDRLVGKQTRSGWGRSAPSSAYR
jgi:hypothetical protein